MAELTITCAGKEQAALLAQLGRKTFYDAFAAQNKEEDMQLYLSTRFTTGSVAAEFDEPGAKFYIAYAGGVAVGYMKTGITTPQVLSGKKCMELERLYLLETQHGKGWGRQMLHHCIDIARAEGYEILWLGVWEHNPKAIGLYTQTGFERFGTHIFQLGNDAQTDSLMKIEL